jgi:hypothetical protein
MTADLAICILIFAGIAVIGLTITLIMEGFNDDE